MNIIFTNIKNLLLSRNVGLKLLFYNIFANIFNLFLSFFLPFFIDDIKYGQFVLVFSIVNIGATFFTMGFNTIVLKYSIDNSFENKLLKTVLFSWIILISPILFLINLFLNNFEVFFILKITSDNLYFSILASAVISFSRICLYFYLGKRKNNHYGIFLLVNKILQFVLIFYLALYLQKRFIDLLPLIFLTHGCVLFLIFIILEHQYFFNVKTNLNLIKKILYVTYPLSLNSFSTIFSGYGFNILVSPLLSLLELGFLNILTQIGNLFNLITNALNDGYIPNFYKAYLKNVESAVYNYKMYILKNSLIVYFCILPFIFFYLYYIYNRPINVNIVIIVIYISSNYINSYKTIGLNILLFRDKTKIIFLINLLYSIFNLFFSLLLTDKFGLSGTIIGISFGFITQILFLNHLSRRYWHI